MNLNELRDRIYQENIERGWWSRPTDTIASKLLLIHSEVSEATEELRCARPCPKGGPDADYDDLRELRGKAGEKPEGFPSEIADTIIRCLDLCGKLGIDIDGAVETKLRYNRTRPNRHGEKLI